MSRKTGAGVRERLLRAVGTMAEAPPDMTVAEADFVDAAPVLPETVVSLRHPAVWGFFNRLTIEEQTSVLDGERAGFNRLAETLIERFCMKANRRRPTLQRDRVTRALAEIGRSYPSRQSHADRNADWVNRATRLVTEDEASFLFDEAISYGLIREEEPGQWTWRHRFLRDWLGGPEA